MLLNNIRVGDKVEIITDDKKASGYQSKVEYVLDKQRIVFHMPISKGALIKIPRERKINVVFFTDRGIIRFNSKVLSHSVEDGFNLTTAELLGDGEKIQRRDYFRFTCAIPTKFYLLNGQTSADRNMKSDLFEGIIKDIGGGGIRFITDKLLNHEDKFNSVIVLGEITLESKGRILHKNNALVSKYRFQYGAEFIEMQKAERELIIQYIFDQQRKILQRVK